MKPAAGDDAPRTLVYGPSREDLLRLSRLDGVIEAVPVREKIHEVRHGARVADVRIVGTTSGFARNHAVETVAGRYLTPRDDRRLENVAVLDSRTARDLFGDDDPLGRNVRIGAHYFLVVGVIRSRPRGEEEPRFEKTVHVPYRTMLSRYGNLEIRRTAGRFEVERYDTNRIELVIRPGRARTVSDWIRTLMDDSRSGANSYAIDIVSANL